MNEAEIAETPEMVEIVARAMAEAEGPDDGLRFERMASATIEAMREMTDAMVAAAWGSRMADVQGQWSDVIDAALTAAKREHE